MHTQDCAGWHSQTQQATTESAGAGFLDPDVDEVKTEGRGGCGDGSLDKALDVKHEDMSSDPWHP